MKTYRKIVSRFTILVVVFICMGLNSYSHFQHQAISISSSLSSNSIVNIVFPEIDSFDDDQINHPFNVYSTSDTIDPLTIQDNSKLVHKHPFSIWQPPKLC
ncbi:MAG: hypothetical protein AB9846_08515 [Tenuifilaceae bacterium]